MIKRIAVLLLVSTLSGCVDPIYDANEKGISEFRKGRFDSAAAEFKKVYDALRPRGGYNLGTSYLAGDKLEAAVQVLSREAEEKSDTGFLSNIYYNLGNAYFKKEQFDRAADYYKKSLRLNPSAFDAKRNLERALAKLNPSKNDKNNDDENNRDGDQDNDAGDRNKQGDNRKDKGKKKKDKGQEPPGEDEKSPPKPDQARKGQVQRTLTPDEAKRILDAYARERIMLIPLKEKGEDRKSSRGEKDW